MHQDPVTSVPDTEMEGVEDKVPWSEYERIRRLFRRGQRAAFLLLLAGLGKAVFGLWHEEPGSLMWWVDLLQVVVCLSGGTYLAAPYWDRLRELFDLSQRR